MASYSSCFFEAMIASGVSVPKAKVMYFAVYWRGPRWEERIIYNNRMSVGHQYDFITVDRILDMLKSI
ncbi:MAG TPA: hypothetical protein VHG31_09750, partial [Stellaceae bacterium]|nr:hypothetical protein [Stellaceae bacterium]